MKISNTSPAQTRLQVLQDIGAPLMSAVLSHSDKTTAEQDAQMMTSLLTQAVQAGVSLSAALDGAGEDGDATRLHLTAIASQLLGGHYTRLGQAPTDADAKRLGAVMQAALPFADQFKITQSAEVQTPLDILDVFVPVLEVIQSFPFGQPEAKLLTDVAQKLIARTESLCASWEDTPGQFKDARGQVLRALAGIYAAAHKAETKALGAAERDASAKPEAALARVWDGFEERVAMLVALAEALIPGRAQTQRAAGGGGGKAPQAAVVAKDTNAPAQPSGNPMAMFAKKPSADEPPATLPPAAEAPKPPESPPAQKPGGNPMNFFKPGAKGSEG